MGLGFFFYKSYNNVTHLEVTSVVESLIMVIMTSKRIVALFPLLVPSETAIINPNA